MKASLRLLLVLTACAVPLRAAPRSLPPLTLPAAAPLRPEPGLYLAGPVSVPRAADPALASLAQVPRVALSIHADYIEPLPFDAIMERGVEGALTELGPRAALPRDQAVSQLKQALALPDGRTMNASEAVLRSVSLLRGLWDGAGDPAQASLVAEAAMRRMVGSLDANSIFYNPTQYAWVQHFYRGSQGRLGVTFEDKPAGPRVVTVVAPGSPAADAGLLPGDEVLAVDGRPVADLELAAFRGLLRKPELSLTVRRGTDGGRTFEARLARGYVKPPEVLSSKLLPGGVGHLRVALFQNDGAQAIQARLLALVEGGAKSFILDLRGNPGGEVQSMSGAASLFLKAGQVLGRLRDRRGTDELSLAEDGELSEAPARILVDGETMSASEMLAAAFQDHGRGALVGSRTYGKGTAQRFFELGDGSGYKMTVSRWQTPKGRQLDHDKDGGGLEPDIPAEGAPSADGADPVLERAAADLVR